MFFLNHSHRSSGEVSKTSPLLAFTLIEIFVVVCLLAIVGSFVFSKIFQNGNPNDIATGSVFLTRAQMIESAMATLRQSNPRMMQQYATLSDNEDRFSYVYFNSKGVLKDFPPILTVVFTNGWALQMPSSFDGKPVLSKDGVQVAY